MRAPSPQDWRHGLLGLWPCRDPNVDELVDIATQSAQSYAALIQQEPRVAMLSFSTSGSARHARVTRVIEATERVRATHPDLAIDGDIQFDAAFVPEISAVKVKGSMTDGNANVMIFPSLEAGNIGYKIAQRIGGAVAIGPILQGLSKPANDLSRGCNSEDVQHMIAVTASQVGARTATHSTCLKG
jgi:phosphate acetyltransferase